MFKIPAQFLPTSTHRAKLMYSITLLTNIQLTPYKALQLYISLLCSMDGMWRNLVLTTHEREWRNHVSGLGEFHWTAQCTCTHVLLSLEYESQSNIYIQYYNYELALFLTIPLACGSQQQAIGQKNYFNLAIYEFKTIRKPAFSLCPKYSR
jgi:hypothetical protein